MPLRPCLDCGALTEGTRCKSCRSVKNRERDQTRGSSTARGYGAAHQAERRRHEPVVAAGLAVCREIVCLEPTRHIAPGALWALAHNRQVPGTYLGPAHERCNAAEGGRYAAELAAAVENPGI